MLLTSDYGKYFKISPDDRDLNYDKYFSSGNNKKPCEDYKSENTKRLNQEEMIDLLLEIPEIKREV